MNHTWHSGPKLRTAVQSLKMSWFSILYWFVFVFGEPAWFQIIPARNVASWMHFAKARGATRRLKICSGQLVKFPEWGVVMWLLKLLRCTQCYSVVRSLFVAVFLMVIILLFKPQLLKRESSFSLYKNQISSSFCCKVKF